MKYLPSNPFLFHVSALTFLLVVPLAHALDGTWLGTSGDWSAAGTGSGGALADGADFNANTTADQTINLDAARTIGHGPLKVNTLREKWWRGAE